LLLRPIWHGRSITKYTRKKYLVYWYNYRILRAFRIPESRKLCLWGW